MQGVFPVGSEIVTVILGLSLVRQWIYMVPLRRAPFIAKATIHLPALTHTQVFGIPEEGMTENITENLVDLHGHGRKV